MWFILDNQNAKNNNTYFCYTDNLVTYIVPVSKIYILVLWHIIDHGSLCSRFVYLVATATFEEYISFNLEGKISIK